MKRRTGTALSAPKVEILEDTSDPEWVLSRAQPLLKDLLPNPLRVTVTLPDTRRSANDSVTVEISEGELTREYIHLSGKVNGGLGLRFSDDVELSGGCIRPAQLDRLIRTPRPIPKVKLA